MPETSRYWRYETTAPFRCVEILRRYPHGSRRTNADRPTNLSLRFRDGTRPKGGRQLRGTRFAPEEHATIARLRENERVKFTSAEALEWEHVRGLVARYIATAG